MQTIPYKFYKLTINGQPVYQKIAGPINDPRMTEVGVDEYNAATGSKSYVGEISDYVYDDNGNFMKASSAEADKAAIASGYEGSTGYSQGGAKLYKLNNGSWTATPPAGQAKEPFKTPEELKAMGASAATGGVITDEMNAQAKKAQQTSSVSGDTYEAKTPDLVPVTLKNQNIAKANPGATANNNFINALYQEAYGRDATTAELSKFAGKTVKDASNLILGQSRSPFATKQEASQSGITEAPTAESDNSSAVLDGLLKNYPTLNDLRSDPEYKDFFNAIVQDPNLAKLLPVMADSLEKQIKAGNVINPNIEITPEQLKTFTDQATTELDPYYQEQIKNYQQDIETSLLRMTEDYKKKISQTEEKFKTGLSEQAQAEAEAGTAFSSERANRERKLVLNQQDELDANLQASQRSVQDMLTKGERYVGSRNLTGVNPSLEAFSASTSGFGSAGSRTLFTPQGNLIGELPKSQTVSVQNRASDLEEKFRKNRILDLSNL